MRARGFVCVVSWLRITLRPTSRVELVAPLRLLLRRGTDKRPSKLLASERIALRAWVPQGLWTPARWAEHGYALSTRCEHCGAELDDPFHQPRCALGGAAVQHREVQKAESDLFMQCFRSVKYQKGGVKLWGPEPQS